jgi:hypothetical protein
MGMTIELSAFRLNEPCNELAEAGDAGGLYITALKASVVIGRDSPAKTDSLNASLLYVWNSFVNDERR